MQKRRILRDRATFTSSTDDIKIVAPLNIRSIRFATDVLQNGVTAPTLATLLTQVDPFQIKLAGETIVEASYTDLLALDCLKNAKEPLYVIPAGDNQVALAPAVEVPLNLAAGEAEIAVRAAYTALTTVDTEKLSITVVEQDEGLEGGHLEVARYNFTPPSTGAYNVVLDSTFKGALEGILIFSTTIPTASANTLSARKVRIRTAGGITIEELFTSIQADAQYPGDTTLRAVLDNYALLKLEPAVAAGTRVEISVLSDDTNTVRLLPILRV